jgi:class 3 adenylate cyclase
VVAERRHVTVLFADMVGFTVFSERSGEEAAYELMRPLYDLMSEAVEKEGGAVKEFTGDGIMAIFGAPTALEDAPLRACRAALLIQRRLAAMAAEIEVKHGIRPRLRIGINTGPAVVGQMRRDKGAESTALGDAVNFAARLQALAEPGSVLLGEQTHKLVRGLVVSRFAGEQLVKGKAEPQKVFLLEEIRHGAARFDSALSRGLTPFAGRVRELETLERSLAASRVGMMIVDLVGEPGIGKSRLLHEFRARLGNEYLVLSGNCSPDRQPLLPFIEFVREWADLSKDDDDRKVARKLDALLATLGLGSATNLGLLLNLLGLKAPDGALSGLDGVLVGLRTRTLLRELLEARCRASPAVMILEDLHWIDSASEELLRGLIVSDDTPPVLIVTTRRLEYQPPWLNEPRVRSLLVGPLPLGEIMHIVRARIGVNEPEAFSKRIAERSEGNALFAEEIASFLLERGTVRHLLGGPDDETDAIGTGLPASLHSLLAARVDRLAADDRTLLQAAAVIGRRFTADLLAVAAGSNVDVTARLRAMEAIDLVREDSEPGEFAFKHILVRDALYQSLLSEPRAALHLKIAEEIERRSSNRLIEVADALAHHYGATAAANKAFRYLAMAGKKSLGIYSLDESERYFRRAIDIVEVDPDAATDVDLGEILAWFSQLLDLTANLPKVTELLAKHLARIVAGGNPKDLVLMLHHYSWAMLMRGQFVSSLDLARRCLDAADRVGDDCSLAYAQSAFLHISTIVAPLAIDEFERVAHEATEHSDKTADHYLRASVRFSVGFDYVVRGLTREALWQADELMAIAQSGDNRRAASQAYFLNAWIANIEERYAEAAVHGENCTRFGLTPFDRAVGQQLRATALLLGGNPAEGEALTLRLREEFLARDWHFNVHFTTIQLGIAKVLTGKLREGVRLYERFVHEQDTSGYKGAADVGRIHLAEIYLEVLSGRRKPPLRIVLKNAPFLIQAKWRGFVRARCLLETAIRNTQFSERGVMRARIELDLGRLELLEGRSDLARGHLARAQEIAKPLQARAMLTRVEQALAECRGERTVR